MRNMPLCWFERPRAYCEDCPVGSFVIIDSLVHSLKHVAMSKPTGQTRGCGLDSIPIVENQEPLLTCLLTFFL